MNIYSHISNIQLSSDLHNLHTVCPYTNMTKDRGGSSDLHNLHKHTMCPYTNMTKDKGGRVIKIGQRTRDGRILKMGLGMGGL